MFVKHYFYPTVKEFMNQHVSKLFLTSTLRDAVVLFQHNKTKLIPVVNQHNQLIGIMTHSALFKALLQDISMDESIAPFIKHQVVTVKENDYLYDVRQLLTKHKVGHAIVVNKDNCVSGILDTTNIIKAYRSKSELLTSKLKMTKKLKHTLQTFLDTTYDGYIVINHKGKIENINEAACGFLRKPGNKLLGQLSSYIIPELKLEDALSIDFQGEKLEAMVVGTHRCLVIKRKIYENNQPVGAMAKIIYQDLNKWKQAVNRLDDLEQEVSSSPKEYPLTASTSFDLANILTTNEQMENIKRLARQSASSFSNVLLLGESGTGKELFARGIHAASNRSGKFVKVNCAAIPHELWESEFFGYADGAFTGAKRGGKPGKFEIANNGTLFLDEIGDMPLSMQGKLLRVLQERELERVGGNETIKVNVRIVAATNKNLEQMVANHEFREDLYYRLNVIVINIPPLRERKEDIPLLATSITKKFSHLMGLGEVTLSKNALHLLSSHNWPGNVRELENTIERAINCVNSDTLDAEHFSQYIKDRKSLQSQSSLNVPKPTMQMQSQKKLTPEFFRFSINKTEKETIEMALKQTGGNRTAAAKLLGISRSQFYKKLNKFESEMELLQ
ncbi:CBS domain-containing protein [Peribacillus asahii]|uniref:CBS domain-containing protein n=1 Tax=Peribacillus asahii TaxID=228899 RepID=A0A398BM75_9BACI|nr:sigma 54-interacting transcriptional regulator [Peribacillus asahii]RID88496.1 CBS domain-containing protein [Peribacillus asahii]